MSQPQVIFENDQWRIRVDGVTWVRDLSLSVRHQGEWQSTTSGQLRMESIHNEAGHVEVVYHDEDGPCVALRAQPFERAIRFEAEALRNFENTEVADSFVESTFRVPVFHFEQDAQCLAYVWGKVDQRKDIPGEDWPHAVFDPSLRNLPKDKAFAPVVLSRNGQSCVISPCSHFMVSPIHLDGELTLARGLSGAINEIKTGLKTQTVMVFGQDPIDTLMVWGALLQEWGGKQALNHANYRLLSKLGYWNAYGAYYAELFAGMNGEKLDQLGKHFNELRLPVNYVGLDLWYEFDHIGFAKSFRPDLKRFPDDLSTLADENDKPYWFHLSAFDKHNKYSEKYAFEHEAEDGSTYPVDERFYQDLGQALKAQGAEGVWYDWLFVQQFDVKALRNDPEAADRWYRQFVNGFGASGLPVLLCMTTAGFLIGSTQFNNVLASRTYTDYLFKREEQLKQLPEFGRALPEQEYLIQDMLMGTLLDALGLASFYDLFISNADHPEGFHDPLNVQEAWRRALSSGIVGFGDKLGCENTELLWRFMLPDGTLCQPDHHPHIAFESLFESILVSQTETRVSHYAWIYLSAFNVSASLSEYRFEVGAEMICFDPIKNTIAEPKVALEAAQGKYWMLAPQHRGVAFLGLVDKFVPVSSAMMQHVAPTDLGWDIVLRLPSENTYRLGAYGEQPLELIVKNGLIKNTEAAGAFYVWDIHTHAPEVEVQIKRV